MGLPQAARRKAAPDEAIASLEKHGVYELVPITTVSAGQRVLGTRRVNNIKADDTHRTRLVVHGWSQIPGTDSGGAFSPVCRLQIIRMMRSISADLDYTVFILDVQTKFLNANGEDVFTNMAPSCGITNNSGVPLVMKPKKNLYGLRQSPRNWFVTMGHHLAKLGFRRSNGTRAFTYSRMILTLLFLRCTWTMFFYWAGRNSC